MPALREGSIEDARTMFGREAVWNLAVKVVTYPWTGAQGAVIAAS